MNISVVIPSFNSEVLLEKNIPSVLLALSQYKAGTVEVIVSDDGSTDNSKEMIKSLVEKYRKEKIPIIAIYNELNRGFSTNVNRGVKKASGEIIILLNTDVSPHKDFLAPLIAHFSNPQVFAVGCLDESHEQGKIVHRGRGKGTWQKGLLCHSKAEINDEQDTLWVSGGSAAFRKEIWEKLEGLQELYNPFYWEDIDISYRARKAGFLTIFEKKSIVIHEHSSGSIQTNFKQEKIQQIAYRNQLLFSILNATDIHIIIQLIYWLPYTMLASVFDTNWNLLVGFIRALILLPQVLVIRIKNKKLFIKTDAETVVER